MRKNPQKFLITPIHPSWHFYTTVVGVFCGIVASLLFSLRICGEAPWLYGLLGLALFLISIQFPVRILLLPAFLAGLIFGNLRAAPQLTSQEFFASNSGQTAVITGTIFDDPDFSEGNNVIHLKNLCLKPTDPGQSAKTQPTDPESQLANQGIDGQQCFSGTAYVKLARKIDAERSDRIILQGKLGDGFGTFTTSFFRPTVLGIERVAPGDIFAKFKNSFANRTRDYIVSPEVDLGLGYLMGLKSSLSDDFSEALRTVGMTHVIVASGAHLGILVGAAKKLFGRLSKFAGLLSALLLITAFVSVVGFTPSMTRAALVATLSLLMGYVGRQFTPSRLLGLVATLTLLVEPTNFLSLGWQLSFASFFGILILAPRLSKFLYGGKTPPWLANMLITSFATSLVCAPILIYNFGSISLLAFVANLIILPTLPYAMLLVFLTGALSFLPTIAGLVALPATWLLGLHINLVNSLADKTMFVINLPASDPRFFLMYLPIILLLLWSFRSNKPRHPPPPLTKNRELCYNNEHDH